MKTQTVIPSGEHALTVTVCFELRLALAQIT